MEFKPKDIRRQHIKAPYFEDARADIAPGYSTRKTERALRDEIIHAISAMGGGGVVFIEGTYLDESGRKRYGWLIEFNYEGHNGRIQVAALPIKIDTGQKQKQAMRQALYVVVQQLKAQLTAQVFSPGYMAITPYLLIPGHDKTLGEMVIEANRLPNLNPPQILTDRVNQRS